MPSQGLRKNQIELEKNDIMLSISKPSKKTLKNRRKNRSDEDFDDVSLITKTKPIAKEYETRGNSAFKSVSRLKFMEEKK